MKQLIITLFILSQSLGIYAESRDNFNSNTFHINFITPSIVRVQCSKNGKIESNNTGVCVYPEQNVEVKREETVHFITFRSSELTVIYNKLEGTVAFRDNKSKEILKQLTCDTINRSTQFLASFYSPGEKGIYGLGSQMEDYLNLQGKTLYLTQHNLKIHIPMLVSTNDYGLMFDAGCAMIFSSKKIGNEYNYSMQLEAAKTLDYYFISGDVVAGYRFLTGNVSLMPRYVFGYTQSKERYVSSDDIISTLKEYRRRHVPIDMIVQDWNYWPQGWGYMKMNRKYYPDPKALADTVHQLHAKLMVSIWPNPQGCPEADDFKAHGMMLPNEVYDAFNPEARKLFWKYADNEFFSKGFDAWWCDSSEPLDGDWNRPPMTTPDGKQYGWDHHEYRWRLNSDILSLTLGAERSSLYSLYHAKGIYENQRQQCSDKRVVNLTRSAFAGQQRYATIVWNGDTHASWESFRRQIPSGLNYMATGNPYWTVDVGCFFVKNDNHRWYYKGEFPEGVKSDAYKEFYTRMFQWATFLPVLRSHGSDTPREIWQFGEPGTPYYDAILKMINFRYAHIPYIYSMAAKQTNSGYSMARMLAFEFTQDNNVFDIKDQYMFGNYLVCPVTHPLSETPSRKVYLPEGTTWIDYWTNHTYNGGQWIECPTEISRLPLFVKTGSIIPTTEVAEYTDAQIGKPITFNIYPGNNAEFILYEDEGDNYNYEKGAYSVIPVTWDETKHTLTIGQRTGSFPGMQNTRTFIIRTTTTTKTVTYSGKKIHIKI